MRREGIAGVAQASVAVLKWVACALCVLCSLAGATATRAQGLVNITFDVTLPDNTPSADRIYVAGNFQNPQWEPGATPLERDGLRARGTVTVAQGSSLEFKFTRGAWAQVEKAEDCSEVANRKAQADADKTITATIANWADRCVPLYDRRAQSVKLASRSLGVSKEFFVYTPPGYADSQAQRYPVLYLFRGHQGEWLGKNQDSSRGGRNVIDVYEEQLAAGLVGPMILVFPGISSEDNVVSGMATNFLGPGLTNASGVGTGKFEDYLMQEVIPYVDGHFRTIAHRTGRGVDGFSLGGFMSTKVAAQHPERFRTVGSFDGTFMYADPTCQYIDASDTVFTNSMFDPVYGAPLVPGGPRSLDSSAYAARNNAANLICNSTPEKMQSLAWFIQYGPLSKEPLDANYRRGEHLMQKLRDKGVTNAFADPVLDGGHKWAVADEHMRQTLPLHWGVLRASTALQCGVNFALASGGATVSASSTYSSRNYSPASAIDGERAGANWEQGGGWNDATRGLWPDWLQVDFNGAKSINEIRVYTLQDNFRAPIEPGEGTQSTLYGLLDFDVQFWDGAQWQTVPGGNVRGNDRAMRVLDFPEVTTTKIRVVVNAGRGYFSRIVEVEAFGCGAQ